MTPTRALVLASSAAFFLSAPARAASSLSAADATDWQRLLTAQNAKVAVDFNDHVPPRIPKTPFERLFMWNEIGLDCTAIDHTPVPPDQHRVFGEQFGPARASRAMAIADIAAFEAVNAIYQEYRSYTGLPPVAGDVSVDYAIARATHDALVWLYPSQTPRLDALFANDVSHIGGTAASRAAGNALGIAAAQSIIVLRARDGSEIRDPRIGIDFEPKTGPGYWSADPVSGSKLALGAFWGHVKPFVLTSGDQYRAAPPPSLTSDLYTASYKLTYEFGGDPRNHTPTKRTARQTLKGVYWTYDGTPYICAPPRLYNQVARTLAFQHGINTVEDASRFMALVNTAMADAAISAWDAKYYYQLWRPVTAIRNAASTGNHDTPQDPTWYPLGAQATNTHGPNFTPPFPSYPSGHAVFGGALFQMLRHYWPDQTPFTFISDEYNGKNYDIYGKLQKLHPLSYASFKDAEWDNAESRIWIGVHWQFDATNGIREGNQVADWVFSHAFQPVGKASPQKN